LCLFQQRGRIRHCCYFVSLVADYRQCPFFDTLSIIDMPDSSMPPPSPATVKPPSLVKAIITAALLIFVDAFVLNQGVFSALIGLCLIFIGLPLAFRRKYAPVRRQKLRNLGIYVAAVVLVFVFNTINNRLAESRADDLIVAVNAFRAKNHRYPQSLVELTPEFLPAVPVAKYTLAENRFFYSASEGDAWSFYVSLPPFGRRTYHFNAGKWGYID
jgi:hypothetical protein